MFYTPQLSSLSTVNSFNFRELRNFRAIYVFQHRVTNDNVQTHIYQDGSDKKRTRKFTYTFYGNAEAISPAQRRGFRKSQKTFPFFVKTESNASFFQRKLRLFPTKMSKLSYGFSPFYSIRNLLHGTVLSIHFVIFDAYNPPVLKNSNTLCKHVSFSEETNIAKIRAARPFFETFFKYSLTFLILKKQTMDKLSKIFLYDAFIIFSFSNITQRKTIFLVENSLRKTNGLLTNMFQFTDSIFILNQIISNYNEKNQEEIRNELLGRIA